MRHLPINWYEGLFLRPHHFQATERHSSESLAISSRFDSPYNYGIFQIQFNREALANHRFELLSLQGRMRDGSIIDFDLSQQPEGVDLKQIENQLKDHSLDLTEALKSERTIDIFIGIPKLKLGKVNLSSGEESAETRFISTDATISDEGDGQSNQEIQFKQLNSRIVLSTQDVSGYELLPLARVTRASDTEVLPQLDETYIPPLLAIDSWNGLGIEIVRGICDQVGQKIDILCQQLINRGIGLESREPGDAARVMMLSELNTAYARISALTFARGVHPFTAYCELCELVGRLAIFSNERRVTDLLPYDHDDLYRIFSTIRVRIDSLINAVRDYEYEQRFFVGVGMGMQVSLEPAWFNSNWQWYIGVKQNELSEQECRDLLSAGHLDWKLGSARQVEFLFKQRASGLQLVPVNRAISALPHRHEWLYYEVPRQDSPAWRDVQASQTLAMRLKDSLIVDADRLQGEQTLVVSAFGRKIPIQFALFSVPDQK
ncbi:MAG: type VI secretion system protein ImpJ [Mariniblastus sp.]|jgi:type VI secretion system protein ImpJ